MANITGTGAPTRKTSGAIGDIYTDTKTGNQYKCIFAYRSNTEEEFECEWKEVIKTVKGAKKDNPVSDMHEVPTMVEEKTKATDEVEKKEPEAMTGSPRKEYTPYSKKNK